MLKLVNLVFVVNLLLLSCTSFDAPNAKDTVINHTLWDKSLKKFVNEEGWVDYTAWKENRDDLDAYLDLLSNNPPDQDKWSKEQQLAYWINAYNAFTIALILDNFPLKSITDLHPTLYVPGINTVWHKKFFTIGGKPTSLDEIEHKILRVKFDEPRIHFAIVCASYSCPKLRNQAYEANTINKQLQEDAIAFINDPRRNSITMEEIDISRIFKWFKGDFTKKTSLINFLNQFSEIPISKAAKTGYKPYDWSLNGN